MRTYVRLGIVGGLVAGFAVAAVAQVPPNAPPPAQPGQPAQPAQPGPWNRQMYRTEIDNPDRAAAIRAQIEARWGQRIQSELGLTDPQMERLRTSTRANEDRHRESNRREADLMRGVMDQLRPGVAANADSLGRMLDAIATIRVQRAQSDQQELRELGQFLTPVQRARLLLMRRQLMDRVDQIRRDGMGPGMGQGMGPGMGRAGRAPMMRPPRVRPDSQSPIE
jgi:Spy/CpxP family protein refolding chaperone